MRIDNTLTPGDGQPNFGKPFNKFLPVGGAVPGSVRTIQTGGDRTIQTGGDRTIQ